MTSTDAQEALDEAMFALSARLKLSGFLDDGANHAAYERVVAVWTNRLTPPTPAAEEREAVALAMLNGKRVREGWPVTAAIPEGFVDGDEWRLEAQDALLALAPIRAAEILAAEARGRADGLSIAEAIAIKWRDENKAALSRCRKSGGEGSRGMVELLEGAAIECNAIAQAIAIARNEHGAGK